MDPPDLVSVLPMVWGLEPDVLEAPFNPGLLMIPKVV